MYMQLSTSHFTRNKKGVRLGADVEHKANNNMNCQVFYFTGMFITSALLLVMLFASVQMMGTPKGAGVVRMIVIVVSVLVFVLLFLLIRNVSVLHGDLKVMVLVMVCNIIFLFAVMVVILVCIFASPYMRGIIFDVVHSIAPSQEFQHVRSGVLPSLAINDTSLRDGYATLTAFAQQTLYDHQHKCTGKQFILADFNGQLGLSSLMHYYGIILGRALEENKIFAWGDSACADFVGGNCREFFMDEHGCPQNLISSSTIADIVVDKSTVNNIFVPSVFKNVLSELHPSMTGSELEYWWMTQARSYLMRFNIRTQADINYMRADPEVHPVWKGVIPSQTINIQMRRGDKYEEMHVPSVSRYIEKAEELFKSMPFSYSRWIFITGDELQAVEYAAQLARERSWGAVYSTFPRMGNGFVLGKIKESGWTRNTTLYSLMDLDIAKDCAAWIGTRASGWSRLFDELRCTKVPKCQNVYIEVGSGRFI